MIHRSVLPGRCCDCLADTFFSFIHGNRAYFCEDCISERGITIGPDETWTERVNWRYETLTGKWIQWYEWKLGEHEGEQYWYAFFSGWMRCTKPRETAQWDGNHFFDVADPPKTHPIGYTPSGV